MISYGLITPGFLGRSGRNRHLRFRVQLLTWKFEKNVVIVYRGEKKQKNPTAFKAFHDAVFHKLPLLATKPNLTRTDCLFFIILL